LARSCRGIHSAACGGAGFFSAAAATTTAVVDPYGQAPLLWWWQERGRDELQLQALMGWGAEADDWKWAAYFTT